ncbi:hypothetical protein [Clostridium sp.]|jgi:hypothetical protein|uniref:hypothetical protein n=1 Tax=Clostridium sp. TaxID=1506 RepID=UPI003EED4320
METNLNEFKQEVNVNEIPMTVGQWLVTMLVMGIPIVGFVLAIIWATGHDVNRSKKTFCQASLIFGAIILVLYGISFAIFAGAVVNGMSGMNY